MIVKRCRKCWDPLPEGRKWGRCDKCNLPRKRKKYRKYRRKIYPIKKAQILAYQKDYAEKNKIKIAVRMHGYYIQRKLIFIKSIIKNVS